MTWKLGNSFFMLQRKTNLKLLNENFQAKGILQRTKRAQYLQAIGRIQKISVILFKILFCILSEVGKHAVTLQQFQCTWGGVWLRMVHVFGRCIIWYGPVYSGGLWLGLFLFVFEKKDLFWRAQFTLFPFRPFEWSSVKGLPPPHFENQISLSFFSYLFFSCGKYFCEDNFMI